MKRREGTVLTLLLALTAMPALAGDARLGDIEVAAAWARATPPRPPTGAVYATVMNHGPEADLLVGASSPAAKTVELHATMGDGDIMRMVPLSNVQLAPGRPVQFAPGGLHIMLLGLKAPLRAGTHFPLTLEMEKAGKVTVEVEVRAITSDGAMEHDPTLHQSHMADPAHKAMHEAMHGPAK